MKRILPLLILLGTLLFEIGCQKEEPKFDAEGFRILSQIEAVGGGVVSFDPESGNFLVNSEDCNSEILQRSRHGFEDYLPTGVFYAPNLGFCGWDTLKVQSSTCIRYSQPIQVFPDSIRYCQWWVDQQDREAGSILKISLTGEIESKFIFFPVGSCVPSLRSVTITDHPKKGNLILHGDSFEYKPNARDSGKDKFKYKICIGEGSQQRCYDFTHRVRVKFK